MVDVNPPDLAEKLEGSGTGGDIINGDAVTTNSKNHDSNGHRIIKRCHGWSSNSANLPINEGLEDEEKQHGHHNHTLSARNSPTQSPTHTINVNDDNNNKNMDMDSTMTVSDILSSTTPMNSALQAAKPRARRSARGSTNSTSTDNSDAADTDKTATHHAALSTSTSTSTPSLTPTQSQSRPESSPKTSARKRGSGGFGSRKRKKKPTAAGSKRAAGATSTTPTSSAASASTSPVSKPRTSSRKATDASLTPPTLASLSSSPAAALATRRSTRLHPTTTGAATGTKLSADLVPLSSITPAASRRPTRPSAITSALKTGIDVGTMDQRRAIGNQGYAEDVIADDVNVVDTSEDEEDRKEREDRQIIADDDDEKEDPQPFDDEQAEYDEVHAGRHDVHANTAALDDELIGDEYPANQDAVTQSADARRDRQRKRREMLEDVTINSEEQIQNAVNEERKAAIQSSVNASSHSPDHIRHAEREATADLSTTRGTGKRGDSEGEVLADAHDSSVKNVAVIGSADKKVDVISDAAESETDASRLNGGITISPTMKPSSPTGPPTSLSREASVDDATVRAKLIDALYNTLIDGAPPHVSHGRIRQVAESIESAVHQYYNNTTSNEYRAKLRELIMELRPTNANPKVRAKILSGDIPASVIVRMECKVLGTEELLRERVEAARDHEQDLILPVEKDRERVLYVLSSNRHDLDVRAMEHHGLHREIGDRITAVSDEVIDHDGHRHEQVEDDAIEQAIMPSTTDDNDTDMKEA